MTILEKVRRSYHFYYKDGSKLITSKPKMAYYSEPLIKIELHYNPPIEINGKSITFETVSLEENND